MQADGESPITLAESFCSGVYLYDARSEPLRHDDRLSLTEPVLGFTDAARALSHVPLPLKHAVGTVLGKRGHFRIKYPALPDRPPQTLQPRTDEEVFAHNIMLHAQAVWDRLGDVELALADPIRLWDVLRGRWTRSDESYPPQMDVIVRHALTLRRTLDELEKAPRRVLRRTHQKLPISRVQELDRRSIAWLVRQPGNTLIERTGDRQRMLAVAREESLDTLENRVLRAYTTAADNVARDYLDRNRTKQATARARRVEEFQRRCRRLNRTLEDSGVRLAEPGITPNYVLQHNASYHTIWTAWHELLDRDKVLDELWRWQVRSWEEYCAIAIMIALAGVPGAELVASSPIVFREEQFRGSWIEHENPLGVFHLREHGLVAEVRYRADYQRTALADFAAPIVVRIGRTGDTMGFLSTVAVWPIWDARGGLVASEAEELTQVIRQGRQAELVGAIVIRPSGLKARSEVRTATNALTITLGTEGEALFSCLHSLTTFLSSLFIGRGQ